MQVSDGWALNNLATSLETAAKGFLWCVERCEECVEKWRRPTTSKTVQLQGVHSRRA